MTGTKSDESRTDLGLQYQSRFLNKDFKNMIMIFHHLSTLDSKTWTTNFHLTWREMEENLGSCKELGCPLFSSRQGHTEDVIPAEPCCRACRVSGLASDLFLISTKQHRTRLPRSVTFRPLTAALWKCRVEICICSEKTQIACDKGIQMICPFTGVLGTPFHLHVVIFSVYECSAGAVCLE